MASSVPRTHFIRASSTYRLEGDSLHLDRAFDEDAPITLTRFRAPR
jgi:hypothetical protein